MKFDLKGILKRIALILLYLLFIVFFTAFGLIYVCPVGALFIALIIATAILGATTISVLFVLALIGNILELTVWSLIFYIFTGDSWTEYRYRRTGGWTFGIPGYITLSFYLFFYENEKHDTVISNICFFPLKKICKSFWEWGCNVPNFPDWLKDKIDALDV